MYNGWFGHGYDAAHLKIVPSAYGAHDTLFTIRPPTTLTFTYIMQMYEFL